MTSLLRPERSGTADGLRRNRTWLPPAAAAGIAFVVLVVLAIGWLSYVALAERQAAAERAAISNEISRRLDALLSAVKDAETGQRGYLLTGTDRYLEPYKAGRAGIPAELRRLRDLLGGDAEQLRMIDQMAQDIAEKFDEMDQTIVLRGAGDLEGATTIVRTDRGKANMDNLRRIVATLKEQSDGTRAEFTRQRDNAARMSFWVTSIGSLLLLAFIAWASKTLSQGHRQRETESWLRSGVAGLALRLQGDPRLETLGDNTLAFLAAYLDAQVGTFFVRHGQGRIERIAAWGQATDAAQDPATAAGAAGGLIAQATKDKRLLHVRDVPAGYLTVSSSLGRGDARELVVVPAVADGTVHAVLELGFLRHVDSAERELLDRIAEPIGIAVRSARDRSRLEELLAETQQQAEEMQTQQEELRVSNEELEEQSRLLKESQSRLESSQAELEANNSQLEEQTQILEDQRDRLQRSEAGLTEKAVELERSSQYKSEFLANMSHELRTPLNSTLILARLLADNRDGNLNAEQVKFAETISSAGNDLLTLINDILDLSRIEAGKFELSAEKVAIARTLESLAHTFAPMADEKGLTFTTQIDPAAPEQIETDPQRLGQILRNLIGNAVKFTAGGEVTLRVSRAPGEAVAFAVSDTGIGIPEPQQALIFEAFRQASGGTNRKYGGTGLGLAISRDLARLLGGDIALASREGEGSVFTLTLPLALPPQRAAAEPGGAGALPEPPAPTLSRAAVPPRPPGAATANRPTPRPPAATTASRTPPRPQAPALDDDREHLRTDQRLILVIEDDPAFAMILRDLAHEQHFQCIVAATAGEGIEAAVEFQPSAIVLDIQLPDHSGLGVLEQLKRNPRTRHIPVHVSSASDFTHEALELGAIGYAIKPVNREELVAVFKRLEARFSQSGGRVLIIEDDPRQRESLEALLGQERIEITAAATAAEALARLSERTYDCVVMDLNLPDVSGYELLEKMAEDDSHSFPPVIVYTGRTLSRDEEQRLRRYSRSIIVKGAKSPERLLDEVTLFLHQVESELPAESQRLLRVARSRERVFEGRRILIVEDDVRNVFALTSVLEPKGATIAIARNGREGVDAVDRAEQSGDPVDLVLMDIMMPEMDGLTAMREIRKRHPSRKLPIIALTAKAMKDDQEKCIDAGANDYIAKPLDVEKLLSLVRVWLPK